ncbi:MAG: ribonuclease H-like domain-containing protein [Chitinophagaceae bacterium]|nr:ribonuclease H-like domain-containing protein [Chitinophagaceae bacterium]
MTNSSYFFDLLLIDIETVPQVPSFNQLNAEWQKLFIGKISKTMPENQTIEEGYRQKAGILAEFAKVICISTGFFYVDKAGNICLKIKSIYGDDEATVLNKFIEVVQKFSAHNRNFKFAGHNIREFDIPFLCRRMLINNIGLPQSFQLQGAKPWEINMVDTLQWWKFGDYKNYISLHLLANVLGIPTSKSDIDGGMVQDVYYLEKDIERIVAYCQRDVIVVAQVLQKFKGFPLIPEACVFIAS